MNRILSSLLILLAFSFSAAAQTVSGAVRDADGKPLSAATVSLLRDSVVAKITATKADGTFSIAAVPAGTYRLSITSVGFSTGTSAPFEVGTTDVAVPDIVLAKASAQMQGVTVVARRPMVEVKADKTVLNIEGTINATGNNALELLRKAPGVMVDKDDNLSIAGKNGVQVYIDGRLTPLSAADLAAYLKTLQSTEIDAIEIITNPSAKYDAAGNAGIVNIRLKKNKSFGTNGAVNAGYNIGTYAKYNGGFSLNHRNKNVNVFGNYNYNDGLNVNRFNMYREAVSDTLFEQRSIMKNRMPAHGFKVGADYTINKHNTVGIMLNGNLADQRFSNNGRTLISYLPSKVTDRLLLAPNNAEGHRNNLNTNLNWRWTDTAGRELNVDADWGRYRNDNDQYQPNFIYSVPGNTLQGQEIYRMLSPSDIDIYTLKADYEQSAWKGKMGAGFKLSNVQSDNRFTRINESSGAKFMEQNNNFEYKESVSAGYLNYNRQMKGYAFQVGLRVENTVSKGQSTGSDWDAASGSYRNIDSNLRRSYTDFFPSAALTFNKNPMKQWNITYSRRIDRPVYADLNPFEFRLDKYTYQRGNTTLQPQYTHSIGVSHTYKYKLTTALNYSHVKDMFSQIPDVESGNTSRSYLIKKNLATQDVVSLNVSYPFGYKSFNAFFNLNVNHSEFRADNGPNRQVNIGVTAANLYAQSSYRFKKGWTAELSGWGTTPSVWQGTFKSKGMGGIDLGVQKALMEGRFNIKASLTDVLHTMRWEGVSNYAGQYMRVWGNWESRQLRLNLTYRFGNNLVKAARQRKTASDEEAKRANGGGGGGIGQ